MLLRVALVGPDNGSTLAARAGHKIDRLLLPLVEILLVGRHYHWFVDSKLLAKKQEMPCFLRFGQSEQKVIPCGTYYVICILC